MLEINNRTKQKIDLKKTAKLAESFLRSYKKSAWSVSLALSGSSLMRRLNRDYRGVDKATDVLSFPTDGQTVPGTPEISGAMSDKKYLGEIVINLEEVKKTNKYRAMLTEIDLDPNRYGLPPQSGRGDNYIFYFLLVHGLLHLVGYDDATEKGRREMIRRGKDFLGKVL